MNYWRVASAMVALWAAAGILLAQTSRRVALVIGANTYSRVTQLNNPVRDAQLISRALGRAGFADVVTIENPTLAKLQAGLREFVTKADGADAAFIYFAGHGLEVNGSNWLIPVDAQLKNDRDLEFEAVRMETVLAALEGARVRIVALDACRDNPFLTGMRRANPTRSTSRGLSTVEVDDVLVIYAAAAGATASDGSTTNSPFASALARWLPEPGLDVRIMAGKIRDQVLAETNGTQRPFVSASISGEMIVLNAPRQVAWTGVAFGNIDAYWKQRLSLEQEAGVFVWVVYPDTPASAAGLIEGDVILQIGKRAIRDQEAYRAAIDAAQVGETVDIVVIRAGRKITVPLVFAARPSEASIDAAERALNVLTDVKGTVAAMMLRDVNAAFPDSAAWTSASTVATKLLPFYPGFKLLEVTESNRKVTRKARYLYRHPEVVPLDWTNKPIYDFNRRNLGLTKENAAEYVKFFFSYVSGKHGRFLLVERLGDFLWKAPPSAELSARVASKLLLLTAATVTIPGENRYRWRASVLFKDSLFHNTIEIDPRGDIHLSDDEMIIETLPVIVEVW